MYFCRTIYRRLQSNNFLRTYWFSYSASFKERDLRQRASRHLFYDGTGGGGNPGATENRQTPVALIDKTGPKVTGGEIKNWYVYFGLGYARTSYAGSLKTSPKCTKLTCKSFSYVSICAEFICPSIIKNPNRVRL